MHVPNSRLICAKGHGHLLGSLSSDVFERRTSTGSEPFSLLISLGATVFVLLSVLTYRDDLPKNSKSPLPVDVRR